MHKGANCEKLTSTHNIFPLSPFHVAKLYCAT